MTYGLDSRYKKIIECMDVIEIVDVLEISSDLIVERFSDLIEEKIERFEYILGDIDDGEHD